MSHVGIIEYYEAVRLILAAFFKYVAALFVPVCGRPF